jgi:hypothetical protein
MEGTLACRVCPSGQPFLIPGLCYRLDPVFFCRPSPGYSSRGLPRQYATEVALAGARLCRVRRPDMDLGCRRAWAVMSTRAPMATALRPQYGQAPCAPCAELQAEVCHTAACSHLLCTARKELELGDACRTQPALGHHSSDINPSPCYSSHVPVFKDWRDVARVQRFIAGSSTGRHHSIRHTFGRAANILCPKHDPVTSTPVLGRKAQTAAIPRRHGAVIAPITRRSTRPRCPAFARS